MEEAWAASARMLLMVFVRSVGDVSLGIEDFETVGSTEDIYTYRHPV